MAEEGGSGMVTPDTGNLFPRRPLVREGRNRNQSSPSRSSDTRPTILSRTQLVPTDASAGSATVDRWTRGEKLSPSSHCAQAAIAVEEDPVVSVAARLAAHFSTVLQRPRWSIASSAQCARITLPSGGSSRTSTSAARPAAERHRPKRHRHSRRSSSDEGARPTHFRARRAASNRPARTNSPAPRPAAPRKSLQRMTPRSGSSDSPSRTSNAAVPRHCCVSSTPTAPNRGVSRSKPAVLLRHSPQPDGSRKYSRDADENDCLRETGRPPRLPTGAHPLRTGAARGAISRAADVPPP